jgi:signal transduction histidine kinase/DNA-binding response OmpR family regulator
MRRFRDLPIKRKLSLAIMLTTALALSLACVILIASEIVIFRREMAHGLIVLASGVGYNTTAALVFNDPAAATETLSAFKVEPHVIRACLYAKDNTLFAQYIREDTKNAFPARPGPDGYAFGKDSLMLFLPVIQNQQRLGTIGVQADLGALYARLGLYAGVIVLVLLAALFVALVISAILQRIIAKPILALATTARMVSEKKDYSVRAETSGRDELSALTDDFNRMLASIEEREAALTRTNAALQQENAKRLEAQEGLTELNETLEQRVEERTREAVEANRAKSEFLASMSHELRTPLNSVIGFANILIKHKSNNLRQDQLTFMDRIAANGKHLLGLINQILDLSKIEARKMELEIAPVALDLMIREVLAQLESQVRGRDVKLVAELPLTVAPLDTDGAKLRQVLINLVGNGLKFTERGRVVVRILADPTTGRPTQIDVADTGIGISKDRLNIIFEAFQQADTGTTRKYGGTGLGLTISQALCQLMGYRIEVTSEVGRGSTFSIVLKPTAAEQTEQPHTPEGTGGLEVKAPARAQETNQPEGCGLKTKVVLVIDDEPDARLLLTHFIESCGYTVIAANSGEEGLRMAREIRPDLITLDLLMPRMDGWQVLHAIKTGLQTATIPVVVISVLAQEKRGAVFGAVDVLQKPVTREDLLPVLKRALEGGQGKVLVVDDGADDRRILVSYLAEENVETETAVNGLDGLEKLERFAPNLVILDLLMPVMDGMTFLSRIRHDVRYREMPVVVCTVKELESQEKLRLTHEAQAVLQKEEDLERELRRVLHELLHRPAGTGWQSAAERASPSG